MRLIAFVKDHFAELSSWLTSERDIVLLIGPTLDFPLTEPQLDHLLMQTLAEPALRACWMAEHDGEVVGHVQLRFDWRNGNATISGVAVAPLHRGRGLAAPMLALVVDEAFARPGIERLDLNVFTINTRAGRLYDRVGFTREGVLRSCVRVGSPDHEHPAFRTASLRGLIGQSGEQRHRRLGVAGPGLGAHRLPGKRGPPCPTSFWSSMSTRPSWTSIRYRRISNACSGTVRSFANGSPR